MALAQAMRPSREKSTIVFVTFESEFSPLGGLAAVMRLLPRRMAQLERGPCFTITPFFKNIARCNPKRFAAIHTTGQTFTIRFGSDYYNVEVFEHVDAQGFKTYLLDAEAFFNAPCDCGNPPSPEAPCNPYVDPQDSDQLLQDALFFCAAVPQALVKLGHTENLILSLQDWQTATTALMIKQEPSIKSAACLLTLHNPYDRPISESALAQVFWRALPGPTVLTKVLPFLDGPLCTVSENFALELTNDPLHTQVYAPHLQKMFRERGVVGIDNGLFSTLNFPSAAITAARGGDFAPLLAERKRRRADLVEALVDYQPAEAWGTLDNLDSFDGPIFMLFGRDDPRQKGYDVAAAAIQRIPPGSAKYVFTPIPGDEGLDGLGFLRDLAAQRPGEVKVFPFRMAQGFRELQLGCSYLMMASLYEPFGAATEAYAAGMPVVARATGGLVQQVAPYPGGSYNESVRQLTDRFHARGAAPTGFLFREPELPPSDILSGWQNIVACAYAPYGNRIQERIKYRLYATMVQEASWAMLDAIHVYRNAPGDYAAMIAAGFEMLKRFSWDRAARAYQRLYNSASVL